mgnify:FL=1
MFLLIVKGRIVTHHASKQVLVKKIRRGVYPKGKIVFAEQVTVRHYGRDVVAWQPS